jgi:hypothetical protein
MTRRRGGCVCYRGLDGSAGLSGKGLSQLPSPLLLVGVQVTEVVDTEA